MKKQIITIAGAIGSGKSTTAKRLAAELGYEHFSSGDLFRAIAKERGLSIEAINQQAELEKEIDHAVDDRLKELYKGNKLVIDSRLAYHWMPESFKIFLELDPHTAAERVFNAIKREGRASQEADSVDRVFEATKERLASEKKRYMSLYGVDTDDHSMFDLLVDTETNDADAVARVVLEAYRVWLGD